MTGIVEPVSNRFKVALSFPGEHRDFVLKVAEELATRLTRDRVFYDEWYEIELLGVGGDLKLQSMYEQADLVVPFFSEYYFKSWCSLEWETIRALLLKRRKEDAVIPVHLDDTVIPGWSAVNFGIRLKGRTPQKISEIILDALAMRDPKNASQQIRIKELTKELKDKERSHSNQIEEIERTHQQQLEELKQSLQSQIEQLEQQLDQERSRFTKQQANLQSAQEKIAEKESTIAQLKEQIEELRSSPKPTVKDEVKLKSEKGVDYTRLRDLLAAREWKRADQETDKVMLQVGGREIEGFLDVKSINHFPCEDLRTINQLWLHYSNGKFGFSVQKDICERLVGRRTGYDERVWKYFCTEVGWRKGGKWLYYSDLIFNLELAPQAHLPSFLGKLRVWRWVRDFYGDRISYVYVWISVILGMTSFLFFRGFGWFGWFGVVVFVYWGCFVCFLVVRGAVWEYGRWRVERFRAIQLRAKTCNL